MTRWQTSVRTSNVTNGQSACELIAGANIGYRLFGIRICVASAVATVLGIGRPAAAGITPTTPLGAVSLEGRPEKSQATTALAWATSPTAPSTFMERVSTTAAIGFLRDYRFEKGIWVPAGGTFVVHNITGGATLDLTWEFDE